MNHSDPESRKVKLAAPSWGASVSVCSVFGRSEVFGKILGEQKWLLELLQRCLGAIWSENKPNGAFSSLGLFLPKSFFTHLILVFQTLRLGRCEEEEESRELPVHPGAFISSPSSDEDDGPEKVEGFCSEETKPSFLMSVDPSAPF